MVKLFGPKLSGLQLTLCLIKPDVACIDYKRKCIQQMIIDNNFFIIRSKCKHLTIEDAKRFYSEHEGKFFHGRLISFITSGPLWAHILAHPDAIKTWRNLMGPTKVFKALYESPDSIRGKFGLSDTRNAVHGSDSEETAAREIKFFFPEFSQHHWETHEEPLFQHPEQIYFDPDKCVHTISKPLKNSSPT